jgi:hypothetical protein
MTRAQRIVAVLYCLLVVYCAVWVPWVANFRDFKDIPQGYGWVWSPPSGQGIPSLAAIATRILAVTALSGAAFLLAGKWKALLFVAVLAGAGILLYDFWANRIAEHRKIHDCAIAKMAALPPEFQVCDGKTGTCDPPSLSDDQRTQQEAQALAATEKECATEIAPKQKSTREEIEEYKRQHGIKD